MYEGYSFGKERRLTKARGNRFHAGPLIFISLAALVVVLLAVACGGSGGEETPIPARTRDLPSEGVQGVPTERGATITVNSADDVDKRDDALTLREALLLATGWIQSEELDGGELDQVEGDPGIEVSDTIVFDESVFSGDQAAAIVLSADLPALDTGGDTVDGMGVVTIDGQDRRLTCFTMASDGNEIKGMRLQECRTAILVEIDVKGNVIGGAGDGNVISGNLVGVELRGRETVIAGNIIGLDAAGATAMPNEFEGIWVTSVARDNVIGGTGSGEGNVISGNELFGVSIDGAAGTVLQGNVFGLDLTGQKKIRNRYAIVVQAGAGETLIGGEKADERNVISGNNTAILVRGEDTVGNSIRGNYIGTDIDGETVIKNVVDVWFVVGREQNLLEDNFTLEPLDIEEGGP